MNGRGVFGRMLAAALVVAVSLFPAGAFAVAREDLTERWRSYLEQASDAGPAVDFPYRACFTRAAAAHGLPETLLLAVARGESNFDPRARSSANAYGLMQILWPTTARHLGFGSLEELYDPCRNVDAGARYLRELMARYGGDLHLALAAYNYGPGRIPTDGGQVPGGAEWYSGYIYRHLRYVLGERAPAAPGRWGREGEIELAVFAAPYRAEAFVETLQTAAPALRLEWFRQDVGRFRVVMLYADGSEYDRGRSLLAAAGFPIG
jgi:soluble lytic murein transglycosylase-like protein